MARSRGEVRYNADYHVMVFCNGEHWISTASSGATSLPGGSPGYVQFNSNDAFGGNTKLFWDNSLERLGIGTSAPAQTLDVTGTAAISGAVTMGSTLGVTGNTTLSGNVGIGTTVPDSPLHVVGNLTLGYPLNATTSGLYLYSGNTSSAKQGYLAYGTGAYVDHLYLSGSTANQVLALGRARNSTGSIMADMYFDINSNTSGGFKFYVDNNQKFIINNTGNVGIGTTAPNTALQVAKDVSGSAGYGQIEAIGATNNAKRLTLGFDTTSDKGFVQASITSVGYKDLLLSPNGGNVGIGTTGPNVKLDVAGPIVSRVYNAGASTTIDWSNSNVAYTSASCGAFTFSNMQDGGTYTLFVEGTTSGTCSFTHSGLTVKLPPGHGATGAGTMTVYAFTRAGNYIFTNWTKGY